MKHLLDSLNNAQKIAVQEIEGPGIVLAGPGSGKTRVLTHRLAWLIADGVDPFRILALTFTNKAAKEMKERVIALIGEQFGRNVWMGTFHSVFAKILRIEGHLLGYNSNYTIYDPDDSKNAIKQILKEQMISDEAYTPSNVLYRISSAKMNLIDPIEYNSDRTIQSEDLKSKHPLFGKIYSLYWNKLRSSNAMDFDDILFNMNILLRNFPEIRKAYQDKFKYILVDEYQDTCFSQYLIINILSQKYRNICVVGDDAQGIYAFRGAKIENILNFSRDYPESKVFKLEQNYRSTQNIIKAANSIIKKNEEQLDKKIWTENIEGEKIKLISSYNEVDEARQVVQDIHFVKSNFQCNNSDFAVLYRTNRQSRTLEEAFRKQNIPYRIYSGLSFYQRKEIKDLMAYFRFIINNNDEEALLRIINVPARSIGKTSLDKVIAYAISSKLSLWEVIANINAHKDKIDINNGVANRINDFATMITQLAEQQDTLNAYELADNILNQTGYLFMLQTSKEPDADVRLENVEELINGVQNFVNVATEENEELQIPKLSDFLLEVSLLTDNDTDDENDMNRVLLMTAHASKGLEFPYVYIVGLEENLFPMEKSLYERKDLEEERRLFYVAITRAMKRVVLSYAESRSQWGKRFMSSPSRFISEIDESIIEKPRKKESLPWTSSSNTENQTQNAPKLQFAPKPKNNTQPPAGFKKINDTTNYSQDDCLADKIFIGVTVNHDSFGRGKVLQVDGSGTNKKAVVFFPEVGKKNLLLKYAKLTIVE